VKVRYAQQRACICRSKHPSIVSGFLFGTRLDKTECSFVLAEDVWVSVQTLTLETVEETPNMAEEQPEALWTALACLPHLS
jgi:hypothetical protein